MPYIKSLTYKLMNLSTLFGTFKDLLSCLDRYQPRSMKMFNENLFKLKGLRLLSSCLEINRWFYDFCYLAGTAKLYKINSNTHVKHHSSSYPTKAHPPPITHCLPFTGYQETAKKETKMASYWGRSWGSWSVLPVGVCVGVGMSQNYANAVWLLKYVNVVRSSLTLCSSPCSPSSGLPSLSALCSTILVISHLSFLVCRISFSLSLSLFACLMLLTNFEQMRIG